MQTSKLITLFLLFGLVSWTLSAQTERSSQIDLAPGTAGMVGRIIDEMTDEPILLANVLVYERGSSQMLTGTTTDEQGMFILKDLGFGEYDIEISYLGYETIRQEGIALNANQPLGRVGLITLGAGSATLAEVEVTAERAAVEFGLDRRVFNVEKDIASSGGTAEDLLRNIPSVTVDLDGNISLRGSQNVQIFINGKPSALAGLNRQGFLQQIAAANVERVEVMTNPSAKYDPEGMGGIINIILKRQNNRGFNLATAINLGSNNKYNGNIDLNYRVGKFNLQGGYSYNDDYRWFRGDRYRSTETADTTWYLDQDIDGSRTRRSHTVRGGLEYAVNERGSVSANVVYSDQFGNNTSSRDNLYQDALQMPAFRSFRQEIGEDTGNSWEYTFDYRQRFRQEGREFVITARHSTDVDNDREDFNENFYDLDNQLTSTVQQQNPQFEDNGFWLVQSDYTHPLWEGKGRLETGIRSTLRDVDIDNRLFDFNSSANDFELNESLSNRFRYEEDVHAAYANIGREMGEFEWQVGVRAEQVFTTATLLYPDPQDFENNYFAVYPSAFVTYNIDENTGLQVNYSRRVNRPRFHALNPFIDYGDPLNPRGGNPYLLPEFIDSYELNYLKTSNGGSLTVSGYFRQINDMITRVSQADPATGVNLRTFANLNRGRNYGLEVIGTLRPNRKLNLMLSGNAYRTEIDGNNLESDLNVAGYMFSGRMQSNLTVGKDWGLQMTAFYRSPGVTAQGEMRAMYSIDFGVRKPVLAGKGTITLRATDLLNTRRWSFVTLANGITDDATFQRESRIVYLGFSYALRQERERRNDRERGGHGEGGGDDMGF
ncbi:MAG: TonB-dependent receptor [Lewinella sp.]|nr:TonB-dependent receptor [Lewinella sp.]